MPMPSIITLQLRASTDPSRAIKIHTEIRSSSPDYSISDHHYHTSSFGQNVTNAGLESRNACIYIYICLPFFLGSCLALLKRAVSGSSLGGFCCGKQGNGYEATG